MTEDADTRRRSMLADASAEPGESWESIADWYAEHVRDGAALNTFARDILIAAMPSDLLSVRVLDVGCGEGTITRAIARHGATVVGVDPTRRLVEYAQALEATESSGATYAVDDGARLGTVADGSVDWVTAGLSLNNIADLDAAVQAAWRVLRRGGRLVFTIPHPCFEAPHASWGATSEGGPARRVVGDYLEEGFWRSRSGVRRAGNEHRTVSRYVMALLDQGFRLDLVDEPAPTDEVAAEQPRRAGLPPFLLVRAVRPDLD